jgi:hypothetical protein
MSDVPRILAFAGSLRSGPYNRKILAVAADGARAAGADVTRIDGNVVDWGRRKAFMELGGALAHATRALMPTRS